MSWRLSTGERPGETDGLGPEDGDVRGKVTRDSILSGRCVCPRCGVVLPRHGPRDRVFVKYRTVQVLGPTPGCHTTRPRSDRDPTFLVDVKRKVETQGVKVY